MFEVRSIDKIAPVLLDGHQAGMRQFFQMERQGVAGYLQMIGQDAWCEPIGSGYNQCTEYPQALGMRQSGKGSHSQFFSHGSIIQQSLNYQKNRPGRGGRPRIPHGRVFSIAAEGKWSLAARQELNSSKEIFPCRLPPPPKKR
jgi:hypothetical protein